jgi:hypothetical protein
MCCGWYRKRYAGSLSLLAPHPSQLLIKLISRQPLSNGAFEVMLPPHAPGIFPLWVTCRSPVTSPGFSSMSGYTPPRQDTMMRFDLVLPQLEFPRTNRLLFFILSAHHLKSHTSRLMEKESYHLRTACQHTCALPRPCLPSVYFSGTWTLVTMD